MGNSVQAAVLLPLLLVLLVIGGLSAAQPGGGLTQPTCLNCHETSKPRKGRATLRPCPRNIPVKVTIASAPGIVILDELEDLYVPVRFDHKKHLEMTDMGKGCSTCHHYQPKGRVNDFRCNACHSKTETREHLSLPGLKGAYHRQCLSCHMEWDKATSCEVCHEKKAAGRLHGVATGIATSSHYQHLELKELLVLKTRYGKGDEVRFTHKVHAEKYVERCDGCHKKQDCGDCHGKSVPHPLRDREDSNLHDVCNKCHKDDECSRCHNK